MHISRFEEPRRKALMRLAKEYGQVVVADLLFVTQATVSNWINGKQSIHSKHWEDIDKYAAGLDEPVLTTLEEILKKHNEGYAK